MHPKYVPDQNLAAAIGSRVRDERLSRGWTLDDLAATSSVSRRMIVSIEQGAANPSVGTLLRLSDALGVGLPALVQPPQTQAIQVTRQGEGSVLWTGSSGGKGVLVAGTSAPDAAELWDWTLEPGEHHDAEAHSVGTEELLLVRQGAVEVRAGDTTVQLRSGDAVQFAGDVAHSYTNRGRSRARFCLAVFEPAAGPQRRDPRHV